jgi:uncharacterized protein
MTTTPDPRPVAEMIAGTVLLHGWRCVTCRHPLLWSTPRCPRCGGSVEASSFGPEGVIWSSTVVRVPVPGRTPPYAMAYVDLDDGPRVLAHVEGPAQRLEVGTRVRLLEQGIHGDVMVKEVGV